MNIKNLKTKESAILNWKKRGWGGKPFKVSGKAFDAAGKAIYKIDGRWDDSASITNI